MQKKEKYVGLDIASKDFAASICESPESKKITKAQIPNQCEGFQEFEIWLIENNVNKSNSIVCMEATGTYSEGIAYYLSAKGYTVGVENPRKVKRAFHQEGHKTDPVDSRQIAEYACRYIDRIIPWEPKKERLEKIKHLLVAHEQLTKQSVMAQNALSSYKRHVIQVALILQTHEDTIVELKAKLRAIDKEIDKLIKQDKSICKNVNTLKSVCGFGLLLSSHIVVATNNFTCIDDYKKMSAYLGMAPYKHSSGTSIKRKDKTSGLGPPVMRRLLRLASQSVSRHNPEFRKYYLRKLEEGKAKALVLNNISNKLLKVAYATIKNDMLFVQNYKSVNPVYL